MTFRLSSKSLAKLENVNEDLIAVVKKAIEITKVDFGVIYGVRTLDEQKKLYDAGRSQTMNSKHLIQDDGTCHAVDLMAYVGGSASWELNVYDDLADAMSEAAKQEGIKGLRWGASWHIDDISEWEGTMEEAMMAYVDLRRGQGRRPFIDGPHFELMR
jgi:peptidoglycan L-alanyl-D-glutamate endopeptidase CwlK